MTVPSSLTDKRQSVKSENEKVDATKLPAQIYISFIFHLIYSQRSKYRERKCK